MQIKKTKTGRTVVVGEVAVMRTGMTVTVTDGDNSERGQIRSLGRPFTDRSGAQMVYGYLEGPAGVATHQ